MGYLTDVGDPPLVTSRLCRLALLFDTLEDLTPYVVAQRKVCPRYTYKAKRVLGLNGKVKT